MGQDDSYREIGRIVRIEGNGDYVVSWIDDREERISSESVLQHFQSYIEGQWFEALVNREGGRCTGKTIGIENIMNRGPLNGITFEEFKKRMADCRVELPQVSITEM